MKETGITDRKDFWAGALFIAAGLGFLLIGQGYGLGTLRRMGPGLFPVVLAALLVCVGLAVLARAVLARPKPLGGFGLRGMAFVVLSVVLFGLLVRTAGLAVAIVAVVLVVAYARDRKRTRMNYSH